MNVLRTLMVVIVPRRNVSMRKGVMCASAWRGSGASADWNVQVWTSLG